MKINNLTGNPMPTPEVTEEEKQKILETIGIVPDFPKPGIQFCDITPLLANPIGLL